MQTCSLNCKLLGPNVKYVPGSPTIMSNYSTGVLLSDRVDLIMHQSHIATATSPFTRCRGPLLYRGAEDQVPGGYGARDLGDECNFFFFFESAWPH